MSGNQGGMATGMQSQGPYQAQMPGAQMPQGMPSNFGSMPQPANQGMGFGGMSQPFQTPQANQMQPPQAIPPALGGGQQPVQMGQNPNQYGLPQTSNYVRNGLMRSNTRQY